MFFCSSVDFSGGGGKKKKSSQASSLDFVFPPQLKEALTRLYHLRRGSLISPGPMRSMDDRAEMRGLYLRYPLEDCVGMMTPLLWSTGSLEGIRNPTGAMQPIPAETLTLWDTVSLFRRLPYYLCVRSARILTFWFPSCRALLLLTPMTVCLYGLVETAQVLSMMK
jgi:hypothetical protein